MPNENKTEINSAEENENKSPFDTGYYFYDANNIPPAELNPLTKILLPHQKQKDTNIEFYNNIEYETKLLPDVLNYFPSNPRKDEDIASNNDSTAHTRHKTSINARFLQAVVDNRIELVKKMLYYYAGNKYSFPPSARIKSGLDVHTALLQAMRNKNKDMMSLLVAHGAKCTKEVSNYLQKLSSTYKRDGDENNSDNGGPKTKNPRRG